MAEAKRYFTIGVFVISAAILFIVALVFFGAGKVFEKDILMETYFDGSVQGLNVGSPVKYRGVQIGEVKEITIVGNRYDLEEQTEDDSEINPRELYVMIIINLDAKMFFGNYFSYQEEENRKQLDMLIQEKGLRIKFAYIGITGLAYLELDFVDPKNNAPLPITWTPRNYYIPSVPNTLELVTESIDNMVKAFDEDLFPILKNLNEGSKNIPTLLQRLESALGTIDLFMKEEKKTIEDILINMNVITNNMKELTELVKQHPSQMFFGEAPPKSRFDR